MDLHRLEGVRVLDLSGSAADALPDHGARVLRVEPPSAGCQADVYADVAWPEAGGPVPLHLDLTCGPDRDTLLAFVREAELLIEAWRPGFADRLGFGFEAMRAVNPALVYLSLPQRFSAVEPPTLEALEAALVSARTYGAGSHVVAAPPSH